MVGLSPFASAADPCQHHSPAAAEIELQARSQASLTHPELDPSWETSALHTSALHTSTAGLLNRDKPTDSGGTVSLLVRSRSGGDAGPPSSVGPSAVSTWYSQGHLEGQRMDLSQPLPNDYPPPAGKTFRHQEPPHPVISPPAICNNRIIYGSSTSPPVSPVKRVV